MQRKDAINWEINTLKEKMNEKYGVLSGLVNAWDDLLHENTEIFSINKRERRNTKMEISLDNMQVSL